MRLIWKDSEYRHMHNGPNKNTNDRARGGKAEQSNKARAHAKEYTNAGQIEGLN